MWDVLGIRLLVSGDLSFSVLVGRLGRLLSSSLAQLYSLIFLVTFPILSLMYAGQMDMNGITRKDHKRLGLGLDNHGLTKFIYKAHNTNATQIKSTCKNNASPNAYDYKNKNKK